MSKSASRYRCDCGCPVVRIADVGGDSLVVECARCEDRVAKAHDVEWEDDQ